MECPKCHKFVEDTWKMCPYCRTQLNPVALSEEQKNNPLQVYKNKAIWSIVPGEIARHIRESELDNFDQISGIIIEEGVSAYIYVNGTRVAELSSGAYEFTSKEEIEKILNERVGGFKQNLSKAWKWVVGLFVGKHLSEQVQIGKGLGDAKNLEDILGYLRQDSVVSIYLKLDKTFPLLFGADQSNNYQSIAVRTQISDINVGLTMQLQISDFNAFIPHYLVGKKNVTRQDIQQELVNDVEAVLRHKLASEIIDERGFSSDLRAKIEAELIGLNDLLHGVSIVRVVEISCDNADFERFRALAKEIYIAEREIDYMQRTQEMKNRVASFENTQTIHEARSRYELEKALNAINKDGLLEKEELRAFVKMLDAQRQITDARSDFEVKRALNDLRRSELMSDEEVDKLQAELLSGKIQRDSLNEMLMIQANSRAKQAKLDDEILLQQKAKDFARQDAVSDAQTEDVIKRLREAREQEAADAALRRLEEMKRIHRVDEMERKDQDYQHEESRWGHEEKLASIQAQVQMSDKEKENAAIREQARKQEELFQQMEAQRAAMYEKMMGFTQNMVIGTAAATRGQEIPNAGNVAAFQSSNAQYYIPYVYGNAASFNLETLRAMASNGTITADTIIRVNGQDWKAGTLKELSDLFGK